MELIQVGNDAAHCVVENGGMLLLHGEGEGVPPDRVSLDGERGECKH